MRKRDVKKRFLSIMIIVLAFSIIILGSLSAKKQKNGVKVIIENIDGSMVNGELLKVKDDSLLIIKSFSKMVVTINKNQIKTIRFQKKSRLFKRVGKGLLNGMIYGALMGAAIGFMAGDNPSKILHLKSKYQILSGIAIGVVGAGYGGLVGTGSPKYKKITVKYKSSFVNNYKILKLKKRARIRY